MDLTGYWSCSVRMIKILFILKIQILLDYTLFFSITGDIEERCTKEAIRDQTLIQTFIPIQVWTKEPSNNPGEAEDGTKNEDNVPQEIGQASFRCVLKDDTVMKKVVVKHTNFKYQFPIENGTEFFIGYVGYHLIFSFIKAYYWTKEYRISYSGRQCFDIHIFTQNLILQNWDINKWKF